MSLPRSWLSGPLLFGLALAAGVPAAEQPGADPDEAMLKANGVNPEPAAVVAFLKSQIVGETQRKEILALIERLNDDRFANREAAMRKLTELGVLAVPLLREALNSPEVEIRNRAEICLGRLGSGPAPLLPGAAIRFLTKRGGTGTFPLLLDYFPAATADSEDDVLEGLAALAFRDGKADASLLEAAKDAAPARRSAAAFVLARVGGSEQRSLVRTLLDDGDVRVRRYAAHGLLGDLSPRKPDEKALEAMEKVLTAAKMAADPTTLAQFFRKRTLHDADLRRVETLIRALGSQEFVEREEASTQLVEFSSSVLPFLQTAARGSDPEVVRRSEACIEEVKKVAGSALPLAAVRLFAARPAEDAVSLLLDYVPFADNEEVEEATIDALCLLAVRGSKTDPALTAALAASPPRKRAAAALVLGRVGDRGQCVAIRDLVRDADPLVRFRAAQGLIAAKDKDGLPVLVDLLKEGSAALARQAESQLLELAGERAPTIGLGDNGPADRRKCQEAWLAWRDGPGAKLDLRQVDPGARQLGLTLVAELQGNRANGNRVSEMGPDGKPRWELNNLQFPIDAQILRNDRILVAEHNARRIAEFDMKGEVKWEHRLDNSPVACRRLPNGNTFVATYTSVQEIDPDGKQIYSHTPGPGPNRLMIYDACKLRNGNIALTTSLGSVIEMDTAGKTIRTIQPQGAGAGWAGVSETAGNHLLIALFGGRVLEVDAGGKTVWECKGPAIQGSCHAVRLTNGHTLVACMDQQKIVEVDREGKVVSERVTPGRPFHIHRR